MQKEKDLYQKKLSDPKWQFIRRLIFARDDHTCQSCKAERDWGYTLEVHHKKYISGREPWEYPSDYLITLCSRCHRSIHGKEYEPHIKYTDKTHIKKYIEKIEVAHGQN